MVYFLLKVATATISLLSFPSCAFTTIPNFQTYIHLKKYKEVVLTNHKNTGKVYKIFSTFEVQIHKIILMRK